MKRTPIQPTMTHKRGENRRDWYIYCLGAGY